MTPSRSGINLHPAEGILSIAQTVGGTRTPDDIIRMAQPATMKEERLLLDFSQLAHGHPEALPQMAALVRSRSAMSNRAASVREAFERVRWDHHLSMRNALVPLVGRVLLYVYCDLNGIVKLNPVPLDAALGMRVSERKLPGDYARRLEWCDGRPLIDAPTLRKPVQSVRPAQRELFEVAR
jgi:hypothetical protein